ncbi:homocysteine S-methyltransferase, putative [Plasmodium malariae]|uniref:Homocysteine S-methyltransferase, putative n=2 Tax=Plasmodium (Plasmodium) TaxID=418103 RepID=A0A1A8X239_PLAMA|nr:homocysteine S-methyltransferase, putative [Plasmodium malariae]SBS98226.1 homocysteine S-methyltransferase, putative [Plasmodium malariae]SCP03619.1 homocysteine S-methyltransferase, putative [Plasmodium malariae]
MDKMAKHIYTLDGGKITELERMGFRNFDFLSCEDNEEKEEEGGTEKKEMMMQILENIHLSYFLAGSDIICTNTFQVNLHSLRKKNISIEKGEEILNTYIDIAYNSAEKYKEIKRKKGNLWENRKQNDSIYEHLENFHNIRKDLNNVHSTDIFNVEEYLSELQLNDTQNEWKWAKTKLERGPKSCCVAFSNGSYSSAFCDFSEYSGVFHKNRRKKEKRENLAIHGKVITGNKLASLKYDETGKNKTDDFTKMLNKQIKHFDIKLNILSEYTTRNMTKRSSVEFIPIARRYDKKRCNMVASPKLFNYGLEYYIDVSDEEIASNCKFKLQCFCRNTNKLNFFSLTTFSNIREVLTFYNYIKYYASNFKNNVIINFYCNSSKFIGCSDYSFFDIVSILLYLDSYNKFINAIGINCVNIENVYDLFFPFKKYTCPYININEDSYKSQNSQINSIVKTALRSLKKNRYIQDVNFFCSPNKSLQRVSFDNSTNEVTFHTLPNKTDHVYNYVDKWMEVGINGFGGCCYYNPYDVSLIDYKLGRLCR